MMERMGWGVWMSVLLGCGGGRVDDSDSRVSDTDSLQGAPSDTDEPTPTDTGGGTTTDCTVGGPTLELGVGATHDYALIEDDEDVPLIHGPQGGWHIDTAGRVTGSSQLVMLSYQVYSPDLNEILGGVGVPPWNLALASYDPDRCVGEFWARESRLDDDPPATWSGDMLELICWLDGRVLEWRVTLEDLKTGGTDTRDVRIVVRRDETDTLLCEQL